MSLHLLSLLIFLSTVSSLFSQSPIPCHPAEKDALLRLSSCQIPDNNVTDCCSWNGVQCDNATGNVITLDSSYLFAGSTFCFGNSTLSAHSPLFELHHLRKLSVYNRVGGDCTIPNDFEKLTELEVLYLAGVCGSIPSSIGNLKHLKQLILSGNLSGSIPASIGNLRNLTSLDLSYNNLSGSIPESIGNLTLLETLALYENNLTGTLPFSIFQLPNLQTLYAENNRLQGPLPRNIRLDSKLEDIDLHNNLITGNVPSWLFTRSLHRIRASGNRFSGQIEAFRAPTVSYLRYVDLSNNLIEGIPKSLFRLKNVTDLNLNKNRLSGALDLNTLKDMEESLSLDLSSNKGLSLVNSKGPLPPNLSYFSMDDCNLMEFPNFLNSLDSLQTLFLRSNKMRGGIDLGKGWKNLWELDASLNFLNFFEGSLAAAPSLQTVNLSHNNLIGDVPAGFCYLRKLDLSFNRLNGVVPWTPSNCFDSSMEFVNLRNNKLHGSIPNVFSKLRWLLLNENNFDGKLPLSLGNCSDLMYLDVGNNNITDTFPGFLGNLETLFVLVISSNSFVGNIAQIKTDNPFPFPNLLVLDASNNKFTGILPMNWLQTFNYWTDWTARGSEFLYGDQIFFTFKGSKVSMKDIFSEPRNFSSIDLSNNQFSGRIPSAIGNMKLLHGLNLNGNNLSGEIPKSFGKMINLESLDLSDNILSGRIPVELLRLKSIGYLNLSNNHFGAEGKSFPNIS